ncbi:hypothetical protein CBQ26_19980 [Deinococcus indicus]|uniref:Uncharacterized protein n=1 Tax=Deinococcus indicus TaxID=223556 RepID=A0A2D0A742_9DEIO|nr:SIR2 family protein [Deinococcus indicus]OWL93402.1 hypothetical protein CBQ26_19980 [Deinococcus indicus]
MTLEAEMAKGKLNFEKSEEYLGYRSGITSRVREVLRQKMTQPVLFVGSGLSRRYSDAPDWHGLLSAVSSNNPLLRDYNYYKQSGQTQEQIGTTLASSFYEYAWSDGKSEFPDHLFNSRYKEIFFKHTICEVIKSFIFDHDSLSSEYQEEIVLLRHIRPNTVITTNYDCILESIFDNYSSIIGEDVLTVQPFWVGKIYKIHGSVSAPESIIATIDDYNEFIDTKKYLSAKLLTYFIEHPILFVGYSIDDRNIKLILQDIDLILSKNNIGMDNIYFLKYESEISSKDLKREEVIFLSEDRSIRVNCIVAKDFRWVFQLFGEQTTLSGVDPNLLNNLMSRMCQLVRTDIPQRKIDYSFETISKAADDQDELASLLGITPLEEDNLSTLFRFSFNDIKRELGINQHILQRLFKTIFENTGMDIKSTDNKYHQYIDRQERHTQVFG